MFENAPDASLMTLDEWEDLQNWMNNFMKEHPEVCMGRGLFAHPDNIRYIAHQVREPIPEW